MILKGGNQPTRDVEELLAALAGAKQQIVLMIQRVGSMNRNLIALRLPGPKAAAAPR